MVLVAVDSTVRSAVTTWVPTVSVAASSWRRRYGPAGSPSAGLPVVLTATATAPLSAKAPGAVSTSARSRPATPAEVRVRSPATPSSTKVPGPMLSIPLVTVRRVVADPPVPLRSSTKVPLSDWPETVRAAAVAVRRRNGPAGRSPVSEPNCGTIAPVVLISRANVPVVRVAPTPGASRVTVPLTRPASPEDPTRRLAVPPVSDATGALAPAGTTRNTTPVADTSSPAAVFVNAKAPVSVWPRAVRVRFPVIAVNGVAVEPASPVTKAMTTGSPPATGTDTENSWPSWFRRTESVPASEMPATPTSCTVPDAVRAWT